MMPPPRMLNTMLQCNRNLANHPNFLEYLKALIYYRDYTNNQYNSLELVKILTIFVDSHQYQLLLRCLELVFEADDFKKSFNSPKYISPHEQRQFFEMIFKSNGDHFMCQLMLNVIYEFKLFHLKPSCISYILPAPIPSDQNSLLAKIENSFNFTEIFDRLPPTNQYRINNLTLFYNIISNVINKSHLKSDNLCHILMQRLKQFNFIDLMFETVNFFSIHPDFNVVVNYFKILNYYFKQHTTDLNRLVLSELKDPNPLLNNKSRLLTIEETRILSELINNINFTREYKVKLFLKCFTSPLVNDTFNIIRDILYPKLNQDEELSTIIKLAFEINLKVRSNFR